MEDDIDARLVVEETLESNGYSTSVTKTVDEARALLDARIPYDLVVLDLMLPVKDGSELLRLIRSRRDAFRTIPVIILSAFAPPKVPGASAVLHKPVDFELLLKTVKRLLAKRKRTQAPERRQR